MLKKTATEQARIKKFITGIIALSLFYLISCGSTEESTPSPSNQGTLGSIKALTLEGVAENSITVSWDVADKTIVNYLVYAETNYGGVFTKNPDTEKLYTLNPSPGEGEGTPLPIEGDTGKVQVTGLAKDTLYRIVVTPNNASGSPSRLLAYTASELTDTAITDARASANDNQVTITWTPKPGARGYLLQAIQTDSGNQLGDGTTVVVVCLPESPLCGEGDEFATEEGGKLKYNVVAGSGFTAVIVPFNFKDLIGLRATDEQGKVQAFTVGVLALLTKVEDSPLTPRLDDATPIIIYGKPSPPTDLGVDFSRGDFAEIGNKLYATGYPLTYTGASSDTEAGGSVSSVSYLYRYRVAGEQNWVDYADVDKELVELQVNDPNDAAVIKAGYGKEYQVEVIASNAGGLVSDPATLTFTYKSFPEPFAQSELTVTSGDKSLTVTWPEVTEKNGSTVSSYTVLLKDDPHQSPLQTNDVLVGSEQKVVFDGLNNGQDYYITVIPNGVDTGNVFTALSLEIGGAITTGSKEDRVLAAYTGNPAYAPQGAPEAVVRLSVRPGNNQATVTWEAPATGSPATKYVVEYLKAVATPIANIDSSEDAANDELSKLTLPWAEATSKEVVANDTGSYSLVVDGLNVSSVTNVFRVQAVRDEGVSAYRYYALGTEPSRAPDPVGDLLFSDHSDTSFKVTWTRPNDWGQNRSGAAASSAGYRVSWGTDAQVYGQSNMINNADTLSYTITGLTPGTQYYVKVEAKNDNTVGYIYSEGDAQSTYTIKSPGKVDESTITYSGHTTNGFTVSWDAVTDAGYGSEGELTSVGYLIQWSSDQGANWKPFTRSDYTAATETLTNLISGTKYRVRVTTTNGFSSATPSEGGDTWTLSLPGAVTGLKVDTPNYDKTKTPPTGGFKVSWVAPSDTGFTASGGTASLTGYEVTYAEAGDVKYTSLSLDGTKTEYDFDDLKTNTEYKISVRAKTEAGTGPADDIFGWTPSLPGAVLASSIAFSKATIDTIDIAWAEPGPGKAGGSSSASATTTYKVEIAPVGGQYSLVQDDYSGNSITATGLTKSTTYRARITAKNIWGEADPSISSGTGSTAGDGVLPPENFKLAQCAKTTSVELAWDTSFGAASYKVFQGTTEIASVTTNSYTDTGLDPDTSYTYKVQACSANGCSGDSDSLKVTTPGDKSFKSIIDSGSIPMDLTGYDQRSREVFSHYEGGASIMARYLKPDVTNGDGSFAKPAGNLIEVLGTITNATNTRVYTVFVTGGTYKAGRAIAMKNHVAIIGGVDECLNSSETATALDGEGSYQVFYNNNGNSDNPLTAALLYGVTVTNGNATSDNGGGMHNNRTSPSIFRVIFSGNTANNGGGVFLYTSFSRFTHVTFSGNSARKSGGGVYQQFADTEEEQTGTWVGLPTIFSGVTFSGNTATAEGGAIYFQSTASLLVGVTFFDNKAPKGGAVYFYDNGYPYSQTIAIINGIFRGNTASSGQKLEFWSGTEAKNHKLYTYNSIVEGGTGTLTSGQIYTSSTNQGGFGLNIEKSQSGKTNAIKMSFADISDQNPGLLPLADNGGSVLTHAILLDSEAVNKGLYVKKKKSESIFYYSADNSIWYTQPDLSGTSVDPPADAEDLTATDATGHILTDKPDLGAYEAR